MNSRTKTLSFLLFLLLLAVVVVVYVLSTTAGQILSGLLAGFAMRSAADKMAKAFTAPTAPHTYDPRR